MPANTVVKQLRGLALPAVRGAGGYFVSRSGIDVAWGDLMLALLCPIGGRPMRRRFGSALNTLVFDPRSPTLNQMALNYVVSCATTWCPHVTIDNVMVSVSNDDVAITVDFSLTSDRQAGRRTVRVDRSSFLNFIKG